MVPKAVPRHFPRLQGDLGWNKRALGGIAPPSAQLDQAGKDAIRREDSMSPPFTLAVP